MRRIAFAAMLIGTSMALPAAAKSITWIDWQGSTTSGSGFTALGQITSGSEVLDATHNNPIGVGFIQTGAGIDFPRAAPRIRPIPAPVPTATTTAPRRPR